MTMRRLITGAVLAVTMAGCSVSTQQEVEMGTQYAQQINSQLPIVQDPEINRYINVLGNQIAQRADQREIQYRFYVVNAREINAFAVPGGFIYVNRGLIERTNTLSQLAGVLGHEIGHVVRRHSVQQMQKAQGANFGVVLACVLTSICNSDVGQTAINVGGTALFAKFSRDDEFEADQEAVRNVIRAGIHPRGIPEMFQILLNERNRGNAAVASWFATHPTEEDRIARAQQALAQQSPEVLRTLTVDSQNFHSFRNRVRSLPAPPAARR
jgi:beta-barrel assembly-enhancing protease